jgi:hypothetical protein
MNISINHVKVETLTTERMLPSGLIVNKVKPLLFTSIF